MAKSIPVTYKNKTYKSIAELSRVANVPTSLIKDRLKRGMTIEAAVDTPKRIIHRKKHYVFDHLGKKYESTEKMCLAYNQKKATYEKRTQVMKWTKKQALTTPPQKTVPIILKDVNGTAYKSINEFCKAHGISRFTYYNAVKNNKPISQILKHNRIIKRPRHNIVYKNKTYTSLADLCRKFDLNYRTMRYLMCEQKLSPEKAINIVSKKPPKNFKHLKIAYTHDNTDYYECIHNNQKYILSIPEMKDLSKKEKEK